jgi:hypothetical protein|tara:strand:+ start:1997 stop:2443 length:447 start_codon:yes stop_codon:yes gene_type:complete
VISSIASLCGISAAFAPIFIRSAAARESNCCWEGESSWSREDCWVVRAREESRSSSIVASMGCGDLAPSAAKTALEAITPSTNAAIKLRLCWRWASMDGEFRVGERGIAWYSPCIAPRARTADNCPIDAQSVSRQSTTVVSNKGLKPG